MCLLRYIYSTVLVVLFDCNCLRIVGVINYMINLINIAMLNGEIIRTLLILREAVRH